MNTYGKPQVFVIKPNKNNDNTKNADDDDDDDDRAMRQRRRRPHIHQYPHKEDLWEYAHIYTICRTMGGIPLYIPKWRFLGGYPPKNPYMDVWVMGVYPRVTQYGRVWGITASRVKTHIGGYAWASPWNVCLNDLCYQKMHSISSGMFVWAHSYSPKPSNCTTSP